MRIGLEKWLLVSNCHAIGLANCIEALNPKVKVTSIQHVSYKREPSKINDQVPLYDRVIVHPAVLKYEGADFSRATSLSTVPSVTFRAYHPDFTTIRLDGGQLAGPLGPHHSLLVLAGNELGLPAQQIVSLFRGDVYEACGYFTFWASERDSLLKTFSHWGVDIADAMRQWGRNDAFMYTFAHPKIRCINDIAKALLRSLGMEVKESHFLPVDNLVQGTCCPVYPEIGEVLGAPQGSYLFKPAGSYRCLDLVDFVTASLECYRTTPKQKMLLPSTLPSAVQGRYDHVKAVITGLRT